MASGVCLLLVLSVICALPIAAAAHWWHSLSALLHQDSSDEATSVHVLWGIADTHAIVGHYFHYAVPSHAFLGDHLRYTTCQVEGHNLPEWLYFNETTRTFLGIARPQDIGIIQIKVTAHSLINTTATSTFALVIQPDNAGSVATWQHCMLGYSAVEATILLDAEHLSARDKVQLLTRMAAYLSRDVRSLRLGVGREIGGRSVVVLQAGPGNSQLSSKLNPMRISWPAGCTKLNDNQQAYSSVMQRSIGSGRVSRHLGYLVSGWFLAASPPILSRVRREAIMGTLTPTSTPQPLPSSAVRFTTITDVTSLSSLSSYPMTLELTSYVSSQATAVYTSSGSLTSMFSSMSDQTVTSTLSVGSVQSTVMSVTSSVMPFMTSSVLQSPSVLQSSTPHVQSTVTHIQPSETSVQSSTTGLPSSLIFTQSPTASVQSSATPLPPYVTSVQSSMSSIQSSVQSSINSMQSSVTSVQSSITSVQSSITSVQSSTTSVTLPTIIQPSFTTVQTSSSPLPSESSMFIQTPQLTSVSYDHSITTNIINSSFITTMISTAYSRSLETTALLSQVSSPYGIESSNATTLIESTPIETMASSSVFLWTSTVMNTSTFAAVLPTASVSILSPKPLPSSVSTVSKTSKSEVFTSDTYDLSAFTTMLPLSTIMSSSPFVGSNLVTTNLISPTVVFSELLTSSTVLHMDTSPMRTHPLSEFSKWSPSSEKEETSMIPLVSSTGVISSLQLTTTQYPPAECDPLVSDSGSLCITGTVSQPRTVALISSLLHSSVISELPVTASSISDTAAVSPYFSTMPGASVSLFIDSPIPTPYISSTLMLDSLSPHISTQVMPETSEHYTFIEASSTTASPSISVESTMSDVSREKEMLTTAVFVSTHSMLEISSPYMTTTMPEATSATVEASSALTTTVFAVNQAPRLVNPLKPVSVLRGSYFERIIPADTFYDVEQGDTRSLRLSVQSVDDKSSWLQLDATRQLLYGLAFSPEVPSESRYLLEAVDNENASQLAVQHVYVQPLPAASHVFTLKLLDSYSLFVSSPKPLLHIARQIALFHGDTSAAFLRVFNGSVIVEWTNTSLGGDVCSNDAVQRVYSRMAFNGSLHDDFRAIFIPEFHPVSLQLRYEGACDLVDSPGTVSTNTAATSVAWIALLVGAIVVFIVLVIVACVVCIKCRRIDGQFIPDEDKPIFCQNRKPVMLADELEMKEIGAQSRKPVLMPDDSHPCSFTNAAFVHPQPPPSYPPTPTTSPPPSYHPMTPNKPPPAYHLPPVYSQADRKTYETLAEYDEW